MDPPKPQSPSSSPSSEQQQQQQQQPHQDSNTNTNQNDTTNSSHAMDNFKALVIKLALASAKAKSSLTPSQTLLLEQRLNDFIPHFHTPDHPPYSAMIQSAIEELSDEGGSSDEAISEFIKENNKDLPWAHDTLLKRHLSELCKSGDIVEIRNRCYVLGDTGTRINPISSSSPSPTSSAGASPILSLSSSSISDLSSSSSSSTGAYLEKKWSKEQRRKRHRRRKRRVEGRETRLTRTKAPVRRRGKPSKKDVRREKIPFDAKPKEEQLTIGVREQLKEPDEFQEEQNGSDEQSGEDNTKIDSEPHEQDQANQKQGRKKCMAHKECAKGKEILQMLTWVPGWERGGARRKLVFEEMQTVTEDMEAIKVEDQMIEDKTDKAEEGNRPIEDQNEVAEEQKKVSGKQFEITEQNQAEGTTNIIVTAPHYYEAKGKEELVERQKQGVIVSGDGSKDEVIGEQNHLMHVLEVTEEQNKSLQLQQKEATEKCQQQGHEAKKAKQKDAKMGGQIEATSEQNFPGEDHKGLKKRRGRPPKSSGGKKIQSKRPCVPGRKRGRPRKNDVLQEEIQMTVQQIEAVEVQNLTVDEIIGVTEEENEQKQEENRVNREQNQVQGEQSEITEQNLAGEISVWNDTELHGQEEMVCEERNEENEQEKEDSADHNQPEVIEEQTEPGECLVEVIDKQIELEEKDGVIVRQNLLEGYEIVEEVNRLKEQNELHEIAEVVGKQNLRKEQNKFVVEENPRNQGSDAEDNKHKVGGDEISEECNECGKQKDDIGEEQNQQQKQQYDSQNKQLEGQKGSITEKEVEVAEMEEVLIHERNQLEGQNKPMKLKMSPADDDFVTHIDCDPAKMHRVSSGPSTEKRNENFLEENMKQQGPVSSENEENCGTCSKQTRKLQGTSGEIKSSDLQATKELLGVQLPEKMKVDEDSESQQVRFQTPNSEPARGSNAVKCLSSHILVEEQHQLDADGKEVPLVLEAANIITKELSLPGYQHEHWQQNLSQQAQEEPSSMTTAATMEKLLPSENRKRPRHQQKVQSENQGQERPPKLRRSFRHMKRETRSKSAKKA